MMMTLVNILSSSSASYQKRLFNEHTLSFVAESAAEESENTPEEEERTYGSIMMKTLTGSVDGRIDHVLQVRFFPLREFALLAQFCILFATSLVKNGGKVKRKVEV